MSSQQSTPNLRPHGGMGGRSMGRGGGEKSKNLVGSWKKLLLYCKKYLIPILIAVVCAAEAPSLPWWGRTSYRN